MLGLFLKVPSITNEEEGRIDPHQLAGSKRLIKLK